jgi:predicted nucleic acid-binding protein
MHYIDASAILKLIKREKESEALFKALPKDVISSQVIKIEVMRTIVGSPDQIVLEAQRRLQQLSYIELNEEIIRIGTIFGAEITSKTLDSIHLASAYFLGHTIDGIITYDKTLITDAKKLGIPVLSPA